MGGLSVHCYVKPGDESNGVSFSDDSWYQTAVNTYAKEAAFQTKHRDHGSLRPGEKSGDGG